MHDTCGSKHAVEKLGTPEFCEREYAFGRIDEAGAVQRLRQPCSWISSGKVRSIGVEQLGVHAYEMRGPHVTFGPNAVLETGHAASELVGRPLEGDWPAQFISRRCVDVPNRRCVRSGESMRWSDLQCRSL